MLPSLNFPYSPNNINIPEPPLFNEKLQFWHLTHINNIPSILKHGLYAREWLGVYEIPFIDITEPYKVERRRRLGLTEYVPFHFFPWNPFDIITLLKKLNITGSFCYITLNHKQALTLKSNVTFDFPNMLREITINELDGNCLKHIDKIRTETDFTKPIQRYNALGELLVPDILRVTEFSSIIVGSDEDKELIELFALEKLKCPVLIKPGYFKMTAGTARLFLPKRKIFEK